MFSDSSNYTAKKKEKNLNKYLGITTATYPLSRKLSKLDEPDMCYTASEVRTNS